VDAKGSVFELLSEESTWKRPQDGKYLCYAKRAKFVQNNDAPLVLYSSLFPDLTVQAGISKDGVVLAISCSFAGSDNGGLHPQLHRTLDFNGVRYSDQTGVCTPSSQSSNLSLPVGLIARQYQSRVDYFTPLLTQFRSDNDLLFTTILSGTPPEIALQDLFHPSTWSRMSKHEVKRFVAVGFAGLFAFGTAYIWGAIAAEAAAAAAAQALTDGLMFDSVLKGLVAADGVLAASVINDFVDLIMSPVDVVSGGGQGGQGQSGSMGTGPAAGSPPPVKKDEVKEAN
jgi:hypothetical protein